MRSRMVRIMTKKAATVNKTSWSGWSPNLVGLNTGSIRSLTANFKPRTTSHVNFFYMLKFVGNHFKTSNSKSAKCIPRWQCNALPTRISVPKKKRAAPNRGSKWFAHLPIPKFRSQDEISISRGEGVWRPTFDAESKNAKIRIPISWGGGGGGVAANFWCWVQIW